MFSTLSVLVTPLRSRRSRTTVPSQEGHHRRGNRLVSLKRFCACATDATVRFVTRRAPKRLEASVPSLDHELSHAFPSDSSRRRHLSRIECHPSAISPAVEQLSSAEQVTANPRPYFVPSTASASEILTNVAILDLLAIEEAEFYGLPGHFSASTSTLASVSDSWETFDFVDPLAHDDSSDSDSDSSSGSEDVEEGTADEPPQSTPKPTDSSNQFCASKPAALPPSVHINKEILLISSAVVEVTFRNVRSDSPLGEDDDEGEGAVIIPVTSFPHPHRLSPIIEGDEDHPSPETRFEDEDDKSDTETIRPESIVVHPPLSMDTGPDGLSGGAKHSDFQCEPSLGGRRMSI